MSRMKYEGVTFWFDRTTGEVTNVVEAFYFKDENPLLKADVYKDIAKAAEGLSEENVDKWEKVMNRKRPKDSRKRKEK